MGCILGGTKEVKSLELWDFFPDLFQEEKKAAEERKREQELAEYKAKMNDFAYRHNHAMKKGGGAG